MFGEFIAQAIAQISGKRTVKRAEPCRGTRCESEHDDLARSSPRLLGDVDRVNSFPREVRPAKEEANAQTRRRDFEFPSPDARAVPEKQRDSDCADNNIRPLSSIRVVLDSAMHQEQPAKGPNERNHPLLQRP